MEMVLAGFALFAIGAGVTGASLIILLVLDVVFRREPEWPWLLGAVGCSMMFVGLAPFVAAVLRGGV